MFSLVLRERASLLLIARRLSLLVSRVVCIEANTSLSLHFVYLINLRVFEILLIGVVSE